MPAKSKKQQMAAGMAYAVKKGEMPMMKLKGAAKHMAEGMSGVDLKKFAGTKRKKLPLKVKKSMAKASYKK